VICVSLRHFMVIRQIYQQITTRSDTVDFESNYFPLKKRKTCLSYNLIILISIKSSFASEHFTTMPLGYD